MRTTTIIYAALVDIRFASIAIPSCRTKAPVTVRWTYAAMKTASSTTILFSTSWFVIMTPTFATFIASFFFFVFHVFISCIIHSAEFYEVIKGQRQSKIFWLKIECWIKVYVTFGGLKMIVHCIKDFTHTPIN